MRQNLEELINVIGDQLYMDNSFVTFPKVVDKPKGDKQSSDFEEFDHEYVNQKGSGDYSFYGEMYYPLESGKYLEVGFGE